MSDNNNEIIIENDDDDSDELCHRLLTNDPTLTTLHIDLTWPQARVKRIFYEALPNNRVVQEIVTHYMYGAYQTTTTTATTIAATTATSHQQDNDADANDNEGELDDNDEFDNEDDDVDDDDDGFQEWEDSTIHHRDHAVVDQTVISSEILVLCFDGLASALETLPNLHRICLACVDIVSSFQTVVQGVLKRKLRHENQRNGGHQDHSQQQPSSLLLSFGFCGCRMIDHRSIRELLESNMVESINFHDCTFSTPCPAIEERFSLGLTRNTSLTTLAFDNRSGPAPPFFLQDLQIHLQQNNENLKELLLRCESIEGEWWALARSLRQHHSKSLQRLKLGLYGSVSLPVIQAVIFLCSEGTPTSCSKELDFTACTVSREAFDLLLQILACRHDIADTLILSECTLENDEEDEEEELLPDLCQAMGAAMVRKLVVQAVGLDSENWPYFLQGLAVNISIKYLDVSSNSIGKDEVITIGQYLQTPNGGGLEELRLDGVSAEDDGAIFMAQVLQENTSLRVLTIDSFGASGLMAFANGLAHMQGLRKLTFGIFVTDYTKEFFQALLQSLQVNTTLFELCMEGLQDDVNNNDKMVNLYLPQINYWLAVNRAGRSLLALPYEVSLGIWLKLLAKSSQEADAIFFLLQENTRLWSLLATNNNKTPP